MSTWTEYKTQEQLAEQTFGAPFYPTGKFPIIAQRIWSTLNDVQNWINDTNALACEGLIISVINDGDNNGIYLVKSVGNGTTSGVLEKVGSNADSIDCGEY